MSRMLAGPSRTCPSPLNDHQRSLDALHVEDRAVADVPPEVLPGWVAEALLAALGQEHVEEVFLREGGVALPGIKLRVEAREVRQPGQCHCRLEAGGLGGETVRAEASEALAHHAQPLGIRDAELDGLVPRGKYAFGKLHVGVARRPFWAQ